jgi:hypothetical protein
MTEVQERMAKLGQAGDDVFYEMLKDWKFCKWCQQNPDLADDDD